MTYDQYTRARRLMAEEVGGAPRRMTQQAEIAREDAAVDATKAAIRRVQGN